jgi:hypothetical protein
MSPLVIPLGIFAIVALIVAITQVAKIHDLELEVRQRLHLEEMEHQRRMREMKLELERLKQEK